MHESNGDYKAINYEEKKNPSTKKYTASGAY